MDPLFLDTETTGNMPGKDFLCSVAFKLGDDLHHEMFKPPVPISVDAMATHHITNEMVADKETFKGSRTYQELQALLNDHILVAHNAPFDIGILQADGMSVPQFICTYRVARRLDEEGVIPRYGLQYLRYYLKLNVLDAKAHDAAGDVLVLESLFSRLSPKMSLDEMIKVSGEPVLMRTIPFGKYRGKNLEEIARIDKRYLEWLFDQKRQAQKEQPSTDNEDWIYTLQHYLA